MRRDAVIKLGQDQNPDYIPYFEARMQRETSADVRKGFRGCRHHTDRLEDAAVRLAAIQRLHDMRSINALSFLQQLHKDVRRPKFGDETLKAVHQAILAIESYMARGNLVGTAFRGLSLAAVLLVAALGLAITFV